MILLMEKSYVIYALVDPRSPEDYRYVGMTRQVGKRRHQHVREAKESDAATHKLRWLRKLLAAGVEPELIVLESELVDKEAACTAEIRWHRDLTEQGHKLTNSAPAGYAGWPLLTPEQITARGKAISASMTPEVRARIGKAARNISPETRQKIADGARGRRHTPEARAKISQTKRERMTDEVRARYKAAATNRTPEHNAKIAAATRARKKVECECGRKIALGGAMSNHQKSTGHKLK